MTLRAGARARASVASCASSSIRGAAVSANSIWARISSICRGSLVSALAICARFSSFALCSAAVSAEALRAPARLPGELRTDRRAPVSAIAASGSYAGSGAPASDAYSDTRRTVSTVGGSARASTAGFVPANWSASRSKAGLRKSVAYRISLVSTAISIAGDPPWSASTSARRSAATLGRASSSSAAVRSGDTLDATAAFAVSTLSAWWRTRSSTACSRKMLFAVTKSSERVPNPPIATASDTA